MRSKKSLWHKYMHPVYKLLASIVFAAIAFLILYSKDIDTLNRVMICWNAFSFMMLLIDWLIFIKTPVDKIYELANAEDEGRVAIFIIVLISTFASMLAVGLLLTTQTGGEEVKLLHVVSAVIGMIFSWLLVHTLFTIHYAHIYYGDEKEGTNKPKGGLGFPQKEKPDFLDFAYFSFVIGMTFQVSDVEITTRRIRRLALLHGIISFGYNTVIVALSINTLAGLTQGSK